METQRGLLEPPPPSGRHLIFDLRAGADPRSAVKRLAAAVPEGAVIGLGEPLIRALDAQVEGLRVFPALAGKGLHVPSAQGALWAFVRAESASLAFDGARAVQTALGADFELREEISTFMYRDSRDLSGYVDGTENPVGDKAVAAAVIREGALAGSSFAAVQRWLHDLPQLQGMSGQARDHVIGRRLEDNEEIEDAPESAHVKRSAQESFDPEAFMVRRSMPWSERGQHGLYFVAFVESLDRFERVLRRMVGLDDGVADALFTFTRPETGGYYWCPPGRGGHLDLSALLG